MIDTLIIFGAEYLIWVSVAIGFVSLALLPKDSFLRALALIAIAFPLTYLVAKFASALYYHPRPFVTYGFTPLVYHSPDNGFPSDHTLLASAVAVVVYAYRKRIGLLLAAFAVGVGVSRVYAGVHSPVDVAASMLIAAATTFAAYHLLRRFSRT